ncbi:hypothetical protein OHT57_26685 [Streptomyces sp. NBC_00285]|nr:hypothetical protein [Streptomyces sp. NBC_00285]
MGGVGAGGDFDALAAAAEQAKKNVPRLRALGCDVVFLTDHSGLDGSSSCGDSLPYIENASNLVAQQVPGIDAILVGHTHVEVTSYTVKNEETGEDVLLSEPYCWGYRNSFAAHRTPGLCWEIRAFPSRVLQAGGEATLMVATRSVADSGPAESADVHTGRFCCLMYCLTVLSGAPSRVPAK